ERVVVADPVPLELGRPGLDRGPAELIHGALDATARNAADRGPVGADEHGRASRAGRAAPSPHHGGHADGMAFLPPAGQLRQNIAHTATMHRAIAGAPSPDHAPGAIDAVPTSRTRCVVEQSPIVRGVCPI